MSLTTFLYIVIASQGLPVVAVLAVGGRHPAAAHRRLALLCCAMLLSDLVGRVAARTMGNNLWVSWFMQPLEVALTLWVLMEWQTSHVARAAYARALVLILVISLGLLLVTDPQQSFNRWIGTAQALIALSACLHTAVQRALDSRERITEQDWFWICAGLSLFWLSYVPVFPFVDAVLGTHLQLARTVLIARAGLIPIALILMTWGVLCRWRYRALPGHSSVPALR